MLTTYIRDAYSSNERAALADAIETLTSAEHAYGWASAGVYCFWDTDTSEILYIGLAVNLAQRFRQHNGLVGAPERGCKIEKINEWFLNHERLGYSILVQSSMNQPTSAEFAASLGVTREHLTEKFGSVVTEGQDAIEKAEGFLIASYKAAHNVLPHWNKIGGATTGAKAAAATTIGMAELFTPAKDHPRVARTSIRRLAEDFTLLRWEEYLHAVRILSMGKLGTFRSAWGLLNDLTTKNEIIQAAYLPPHFIDAGPEAESPSWSFLRLSTAK